MTRKLISSGSPFEATMGYSRAVVQDGWVFVSGTTGYDYAAMEMPDDIADQCRNALNTIKGALEQAGSSLEQTVRVHYLVKDISQFEACFPVLQDFFGEIRPAATVFEAKLFTEEMKIEIEVTAKA